MYLASITQRRLTLQRFVRDLHRWRDVVPVKDKHLFEQVVHVLWGLHLNKTRVVYQSDNLFHFQELFQNLLSEMGTEEFEDESDWHGGTPLSVIQARYAKGSWISGNTQSVSVSTPDMNISTHRSEIYKGNWNAHDFEVIKLASTVIFCLVIAVLLCKSRPQRPVSQV